MPVSWRCYSPISDGMARMQGISCMSFPALKARKLLTWAGIRSCDSPQFDGLAPPGRQPGVMRSAQ
jgi:hypothetical protein